MQYPDVHLDDADWAVAFETRSAQLDNNATGQLALWPLDDLVAEKRYVPCPRRGTHRRLTECWMCWCDVAYGHATADDVLAAGEL